MGPLPAPLWAETEEARTLRFWKPETQHPVARTTWFQLRVPCQTSRGQRNGRGWPGPFLPSVVDEEKWVPSGGQVGVGRMTLYLEQAMRDILNSPKQQR